MVRVVVDFDENTHKKLMMAKSGRTWRDVILGVLPINTDEMLRDAIFDKFGEVRDKAELCKRKDIYDLVEVLRAITLRCINDGVDKNKIIELVDSLLEVR